MKIIKVALKTIIWLVCWALHILLLNIGLVIYALLAALKYFLTDERAARMALFLETLPWRNK